MANETYIPDNSVGPLDAMAHGQTRTLRRKSFKAGIISYQNHTLSVDCIIRDMNSNGAKLKFEKNALVPDHFMLTIPIEGKKVDCQVKWRNNLEVGVLFVAEMQDDTLNVRKQSVEVQYVVPKKSSILKKRD